jgi:hypothetical protein
MVPKIATTKWNVDGFITTRLISTYKNKLYAMTVERSSPFWPTRL